MPPLDSCVDIDECSVGGSCGANTDCINKDGDFDCVCQKDHIWISGSDVPLTKERLTKSIDEKSLFVLVNRFLSFKRVKTVKKKLA